VELRRIVVGVDYSTASLNAVRWTATYLAPRATLHLVHVVSQPRTPRYLRDAGIGTERHDEAEPTLVPGLVGLADLAGAPLREVVIRRGRPEIELAAVAREIGADLICVGRSQRRRGAGRFGASTPERLLARTTTPVLVVPADCRDRPDVLLAAVADGDEARRVLRGTAALAASMGARMHALHVVDGAVAADRGATGVGDADVRQLAEAWLARRVAELSLGEGPAASTVVVGEAADGIASHAARTGCGLVVVGRRTECGEEAPAACAIGSTTRLLAWAAPCAVLVMGTAEPRTWDAGEAAGAWRRRPARKLRHAS
jgi:nucleotide-binding universal stress UspA family protein